MEENPYASANTCAKHVGTDKKTVCCILREDLNMHKINFKWVPYELTQEIKEKRVQIAINLLEFLENSNRDRLNRIFTQDETWIYFDNPRNSMWIENGSEIPQRTRPTIHTPKVMISVIWSRTCIKSITVLPSNQKFNKTFFAECVLGNLAKMVSTKKKYFHCDNARPHLVDWKFRELGLTRLEHPPYSPDLAPSDFFLFGMLKKLLEGNKFENVEQVHAEVVRCLNGLSTFCYSNAYDEWMERLRQVINTNGEYIL